jgi:hypothetical protein
LAVDRFSQLGCPIRTRRWDRLLHSISLHRTHEVRFDHATQQACSTRPDRFSAPFVGGIGGGRVRWFFGEAKIGLRR